ncbi:MAG: matrixin family metalloprotease [Candidatus Doudnabacteria bacterium]|nr:matrixin family metalloprotease [Candidatus Doudnabacteria bacterium]
MAKLFSGLLVLAVLVSATPVIAKTGEQAADVQSETDALTQAPNVKYLGKAKDKRTGLEVDGFQIITPNKQEVKPTGPRGAARTACYGYLASGAKWKSVEGWVMNPSNNDNVDGNNIFAQALFDTYKWEDATDGVIGNGGQEIFGSGVQTNQTLVVDNSSPDDLNEVYFGQVSDPNTIAITTVWGVFSGPTKDRVLVEWDMIFNDSYEWALDGSINKMDFSNISTHELGHAIGLADLYNSCTAETMYGYATYGETTKQTLNSGDIAGVKNLY